MEHRESTETTSPELALLEKLSRDMKITKWLCAAAAVLAAAALAVSLLRPAAVARPAQEPAQQAAQLPAAEQVPDRQEAPIPEGISADFDALWESIQAQQRQRLETPFDAGAIAQVLVESQEDANAITRQELDTLLAHHPRPASLTAEEARADVDLLMRAFRSCYAAYYYFGQVEFENARQLIEARLPQSGSIDTGEFEQLVSGAFAFLRDAHAGVFPQGAGVEYRPYENNLRQRYYYTDLYFRQDARENYVIEVDGEDWTLSRFSDPRVKMEPRLLQDGTVCYSPVLLSSDVELGRVTVALKNGDATMENDVSWNQSQSYLGYYSGDPDYRLLENNGVVYISERAFMGDQQALERFAAEAAQCREAKLIVFDIRSNGGGDDRYAAQWVKNFSGQEPQLNMLFATRGSLLAQQQGRPTPLGSFEVFQSTGRVIPNDIPIVVLVDDRCGSSGESMLNYLRTMDNVTVVGSNSAGFQLCGNVAGLTLPNSGMVAQFGISLSFQYSPESVDFRGYEPDIWCDPSTSLEAVWNMLVKYGKITPDQIPQGTGESSQMGGGEQSGITLLFQDIPIHPGEGFGTPDIGPHFLQVLSGGQPVPDFQLQLGKDDVCSCEILPDGTIKLTRTGVGECPLTVTVGEETATFNWYGGEDPPVPVQNCDMTLLYYDFTVFPGQGFGDPTPGGVHDLVPLLNGEKITGYTVENGNPQTASLEILPDGTLRLTRLGPGSCEITLRQGDSWATFRWYGGEV